jgi:hypothetical protein
MPGDGIGNQVLPEAIRVLNAVGFDADYIRADIGWNMWVNEGNALPERTVELLSKHKLGLFGAITSKPKKEADAELRPDLRVKGYSYFSPIVSMRQIFNLDVCIRPCLSFPGNPLNFFAIDGGAAQQKFKTIIPPGIVTGGNHHPGVKSQMVRGIIKHRRNYFPQVNYVHSRRQQGLNHYIPEHRRGNTVVPTDDHGPAALRSCITGKRLSYTLCGRFIQFIRHLTPNIILPKYFPG